MPSIEETLTELEAAGFTPEQIIKRVRSLQSRGTKDYFLNDLRDKESKQSTVELSVTDWPKLREFFRRDPTDVHHPQRIYQEIRSDIKEALDSEDAAKLIESLLLHAKAVQ